MHRRDIIEMSLRDLKRLKVIQQAIDRHIPQRVAASMLQVSERQVRRMVRRVRQEGDKGIVHRSRGRSSNNKLSKHSKDRIISLYEDNYKGFGPTFATEKLIEQYKICVSKETLRQWLMERGLWKRQRKRRKHRMCRPRKECCGQMVILDGSHHGWLEGRGPKLVLMAYIDDATNRLLARFYDYEGIMPAMDSFKRYVKRYGLPQSLYTDKHTTYKSTKKPAVEDQLANREPQSQFERAMEELGVEMIHANSPEAKGRIERVFRTLQDRLVKELRLRDIRTRAEANRYLQHYLPAHNRRFTVEPKRTADVHREIPEGMDLNAILCIREQRSLRKDLTIRYNNKFYQIEKIPSGLRPKYVWVEERMNGKMFVMYKGFYLSFKEIEVRLPKKKAVRKRKRVGIRKKYIPPEDHPWKKFKLPSAVLKKRNREQREAQQR
jgi:transposase